MIPEDRGKPDPEWLPEKARESMRKLADPTCSRCGGVGILELGYTCPCVDAEGDMKRRRDMVGERTEEEDPPTKAPQREGPVENTPFPRYAISVVIHNNLKFTKQCLESVFANSTNCLVIVTDNASTDGTPDYLRGLKEEKGSQLILYTNLTNNGFGEPHNQALRLVDCAGYGPPKYFVVLNNDLEVCGRWLEDMSAVLDRDPKVAIVGIKGTCCGIDKTGVGRPSDNPEYVEASCLMIRMELARKHGLFSPEFVFAYYEDSDLSLRMRQLGHKIAHVPLPIIHHGAATAKIVTDVDLKGFWLRNQKVFLEKWKDYLARKSFGARSIMVRRSAALGDVILTTPVIRALKEKYANATIDVVTNFPEVFRGNPHVETAGKKMLRQIDRYDFFFDLDMAYEKRPNVRIVDAYMEACGFVCGAPGVLHRPWLEVTHEELVWAGKILKDDSVWVAIHPGPTAWPGRNWTPEGFDRVAEHVLGHGGKVLLVGGPDATEIQSTLDMRGKTSLHQLAALLGECALFVGIDSAPMHVATAVETPVVALFGCISPEYRLFGGDLLRAVTAPKTEVGCLGCHHYLPSPRVASECFREKTKIPRCMERLRAEDVNFEVDKVLGWTDAH